MSVANCDIVLRQLLSGAHGALHVHCKCAHRVSGSARDGGGGGGGCCGRELGKTSSSSVDPLPLHAPRDDAGWPPGITAPRPPQLCCSGGAGGTGCCWRAAADAVGRTRGATVGTGCRRCLRRWHLRLRTVPWPCMSGALSTGCTGTRAVCCGPGKEPRDRVGERLADEREHGRTEDDACAGTPCAIA